MAKRKKKELEIETYDLESGKFIAQDKPSKKKKEETLKLDGAEVGLFDFLKDITSGKKGILNDNNEHKFDPYMTCRFLSMDLDLLELVNGYLNRYQGTVDKQMFYKMCLEIIPKRQRYLKYTKVDENMKIQEENIKLLCELYEVSKRQAYQYLKLMSADDIKDLRRRFGIVDE
jgi:hypothetical protein